MIQAVSDRTAKSLAFYWGAAAFKPKQHVSADSTALFDTGDMKEAAKQHAMELLPFFFCNKQPALRISDQ